MEFITTFIILTIVYFTGWVLGFLYAKWVTIRHLNKRYDARLKDIWEDGGDWLY